MCCVCACIIVKYRCVGVGVGVCLTVHRGVFVHECGLCAFVCVCVHTCPCRQVIYVGRMQIVYICGSVKV